MKALFLTTKKHKTAPKMSVKIIFSVVAGLAVSLITPITAYLAAVGLIVAGDQISGTWAAVKRGERFSSKVMGRTVEKLIFYFLAIILGEVLSRVFFADFGGSDRITFVVASFIAFREFWSVLENVSDITGIDIVGAIGEKLKILTKDKNS